MKKMWGAIGLAVAAILLPLFLLGRSVSKKKEGDDVERFDSW